MPVVFVAMLIGALLAVSWTNGMFLFVLLGIVLAWYGTYTVMLEMISTDEEEEEEEGDA